MGQADMLKLLHKFGNSTDNAHCMQGVMGLKLLQFKIVMKLLLCLHIHDVMTSEEACSDQRC